MAEEGQIKKRQHHVPRFVLRRFASPLTGNIWNYDKQTGRVWLASIEDTACERHLYSITMDDGQHNTDIEDLISKIENIAAPLYERIIAGEVLSGQERYNFSSFLAIMFVRTNAFRRLYAELHGNMKMVRDYIIASDDTLFESQMEQFQADRGEITEDQKQRLRSAMLDPSDYTFQIDREYTLKALTCHDQLAPLFTSMTWTVMEAPKGTQHFITSDNPLLQWVPPQFHHPFRGTGGFKNKHAEAIFSLSPNQCWVGHWLKGAPNRLETTVEWVKQTNRITAVSAERFLYSHVESSGILLLAKKYAASQSMVQMAGPGPKKKAEIKVVRTLSQIKKGSSSE